jgi:hypothetical protein
MMRATPKELASRNDYQEIRDWILSERDPRKLQELFHHVSVHSHSGEYELARTAIEILIAESAGASAQRLEKSTKHLLFLTYVLVALTAILAILTYLLMKHP